MKDDHASTPHEAPWHRLRRHPAFRFSVLFGGVAWTALQAAAVFGMGPSTVRTLGLGFVVVYLVALGGLLIREHRNAPGERARLWRVLPQGRVLAALVVILLATGTAGWFLSNRLYAGSVAPEAGTIAVLPFTASGATVADYGVGMVDLLSPALDEIGGIRTVSARTVLNRWNERSAGGVLDLPRSLELGRELGAGSVLLGSVASLGPSVRLQAELVSVEGETLARARADGDPDSVLALVDRLAVDLLREVWRSRGPTPTVNVGSITTRSLPALRAFLRGERLYRASAWTEAIAAFEEAVAADSTFALAYQRLSESYGWLEGMQSDPGLAYGEMAERYVDRLPERERSLVHLTLLHKRTDFAAVDSARAFVARYGDDPIAHYMLGDVLFHTRRHLGHDPERVFAAFDEVQRLDPSLTFSLRHGMELALEVGDSVRYARYLGGYRMAAPELAPPWEDLRALRWGPADSLLPRYGRALRAETKEEPGRDVGHVTVAFRGRVAQDLQVDPTVILAANDSLAVVRRSMNEGEGDPEMDLRLFSYIRLGRAKAAEAVLAVLAIDDPDRAAARRVMYTTMGILPDSARERDVARLAAGTPRDRLLARQYHVGRGELTEARRIEIPADSASLPRIAAMTEMTDAWIRLVERDTAAFLADVEATFLRHGYGADAVETNSWISFVYARTLAHRGETRPEGIRRLKVFTEGMLPPTAAWAWNELGRVLESSGDGSGAAAAYGQAVRLWGTADQRLRDTLQAAWRAMERILGEPVGSGLQA